MNPRWLVPSLAFVFACASPSTDDDAGTTSSDGTEDEADSSSSESSDTGESTTTDSGSDDESPDTVDAGDIGGGDCDAFAQDCPDGYKCAFVSNDGSQGWNDTACVPVQGDNMAGEACTYDGIEAATDDCDATSWCFDETCHLFCMGTPGEPICPDGSTCLITGEGVVTICIENCNPLLQDCPMGEGCYWGGTQFVCAGVGDIPVGDECMGVTECSDGGLCAAASSVPGCAGEGCCTSYCDLDEGDAGCAAIAGTSCVAFFEADPPAGYENVGVCVVP